MAEFSKYAKYQPFKFYLLISVIACFPVTYAHRTPHLRHHDNPCQRNPDRSSEQHARPCKYQNDTNIRACTTGFRNRRDVPGLKKHRVQLPHPRQVAFLRIAQLTPRPQPFAMTSNPSPLFQIQVKQNNITVSNTPPLAVAAFFRRTCPLHLYYA